jgi:hypothetical protein
MNRRSTEWGRVLIGLALAACARSSSQPAAVAALSSPPGGDALVTVGSPTDQFPRNDQNEPALAFDPTRPWILAAGANDAIDSPPCVFTGRACQRFGLIGGQGIYFSLDGGQSWIQPTYSGWSGRTGTQGVGPIGTVPNYYENGMTTGSDPAVAFGPRPGPNGFDWANGSRLYHANIAGTFSDPPAFVGVSAITVSWTDDVAAAAAGAQDAWSAPVVVTRQNPTTASDKEALWVDNAASSPYFGNVYECDDGGLSHNPKAPPQPIVFSRSTDGGATWEARQISSSDDPVFQGVRFGGRTFCTIRTDSAGGVYIFWLGTTESQTLFYLARSSDGGAHFRAAKPVAALTGCGAFDPASGLATFDGIGGTRTTTFPSVDVANGAPTGAGATDEIVLSYCDAGAGLGNEQALVIASLDRGDTWSAPANGRARRPPGHARRQHRPRRRRRLRRVRRLPHRLAARHLAGAAVPGRRAPRARERPRPLGRPPPRRRRRLARLESRLAGA